LSSKAWQNLRGYGGLDVVVAEGTDYRAVPPQEIHDSLHIPLNADGDWHGEAAAEAGALWYDKLLGSQLVQVRVEAGIAWLLGKVGKIAQVLNRDGRGVVFGAFRVHRDREHNGSHKGCQDNNSGP
jgi:hypothetical protein